MEWDAVLKYSAVVKDVAREWASRCGDRDLEEDIAQAIYVGLADNVDPTRANKQEDVYVRAACWKLAEKFVTRWQRGIGGDVSLDALAERRGYQIDEHGRVYEPAKRFRVED